MSKKQKVFLFIAIILILLNIMCLIKSPLFYLGLALIIWGGRQKQKDREEVKEPRTRKKNIVGWILLFLAILTCWAESIPPSQQEGQKPGNPVVKEEIPAPTQEDSDDKKKPAVDPEKNPEQPKVPPVKEEKSEPKPKVQPSPEPVSKWSAADFSVDHDCGDFSNSREATDFMNASINAGYGDHRLDKDHDGVACE